MALNHSTIEGPAEVKHITYRTSVDYTVVGNPTIRNGVLSGIGSSHNCKISSLPSADFNTIEMFFNVKRANATSGSYIPLCGFGASNSTRRIVGNATVGHIVRDADGVAVSIANQDFDFVTAAQSGYYLKLMITKNSESNYTYDLSLSRDKQTWVSATGNYSSNICRSAVYLLQNSIGSASGIPEINLNETYIKIDGKLWFFHPATNYLIKDGKLIWADQGLYLEESGTKTYATQNKVPVPGGFTYGNTTTTAVGWVDIPTQQFTAAPAGATLGKDE